MSMLKNFVKEHHILDSASLLIQVFTATNTEIFIKRLQKNLNKLFPQAIMIGCTTDGEIMSGKVSTKATVLSFTTFEYTEIASCLSENKEDGFYSGKAIAKALIKEDTKLVIAFADGLHTNGEAFLEGFNTENHRDVIVAGGLAGDNATFTTTYVFNKKEIVINSVVAIALTGKRLNVYNDYSFNWQSIGQMLTITKVVNNRVYRIGNRTAVDTYVHYLGEDMAEGLPKIGIEFPLIFLRNGVTIARAVLAKHEDGSLSFAGNFKEGEQVQFGYGDPKEILKYSEQLLKRVSRYPSQAIFVYSCMARRHFMPNIIEEETLPLEAIAPISGFFTYGEFFTAKTPELLNQAMTLVSLSEDSNILHDIIIEDKYKENIQSSTHALINLVNVTSREAMQKEVFIQTQSIFEILFKTSPDGILLIENNLFIECNQMMLDIFGYQSKIEFLQRTSLDFMPRYQPDKQHSLRGLLQMRNIAKKNETHQFEWVYKKANGQTFWADIMLSKISLQGREMLYVLCRDISDKKATALEILRQKDTLYHQAYHDDLTGLPNRMLFMQKLKDLLYKSDKEKDKFALVFIDLDRFKEINDSLGHPMGDKVIIILAKRLQFIINVDDIVARLGGDEFLILLKSVEEKELLSNRIKKILKLTNEPMFIDNHRLYSSTSIGISLYPKDDCDADNLLKYADAAMYKAKELGGNNFQFYSQEMTTYAYENVMMERDLRESIKAEDFEVYYQAQIHLKTGKIIGAEALVRWQHPTVGFLSPDVFIPLSVKTGLIIELDLWVMNTAMQTFSTWYSQGLSPGILALNVSMQQLESSEFVETVVENVLNYQFKYEWLECEMTETAVMKDPIKVISILEELHALGVTIAIDDFGTGYSSLSYLKRLPIDKLKIDQSFIKDIEDDETAQAIVNTIIVLGRSLNLDIIAEGVETRGQEKFLASHGCHQAQGYYYSKPIPAKDFEVLLEKQQLRID
jgi:diguanylate cyclase (GGDEF)-like protein/PAS domain S-box-containing protein